MKYIGWLGIFCLTIGSIYAQPTGTKQVLVEEFTQASCLPCSYYNPSFDALMLTNSGNVNLLKYHVSWPGEDPFYAHNKEAVDLRADYYKVTGIPRAIEQGNYVSGYPSLISQTKLDEQLNQLAPVEVAVSWDWTDNSLEKIDITVTITNTNGSLDFDAADKLQLAIIEESIGFMSPPGTNGEQDFAMVMKDMLPSADGSPLGLITSGNSQVFTFPNQKVPAYIYDLNALGVLAFVQNSDSKEVFNSDYQANPGFPPGVSLIGLSAVSFSLGPNNYCDYTATPRIEVVNNSSTVVTSFDAVYTLNSGAEVVESFSGSLGQGQFAAIIFPQTNLSSNGKDTVAYRIENLNGGTLALAEPIKSYMPKQVFYTSPQGTAGTNIEERFSNLAVGEAAPQNAFLDNPNAARVYAVDRSINTAMINWNLGGFGNSEGCYRWDFYEIPAGQTASLVFDKIDLSNTTSTQLRFSYAHARRVFENDRLQVLASSDCGDNWTILFDKAGTNLSTFGVESERFYPQPADWAAAILDMTAFDGEAEVMVVFRGTSDEGNSLYVDDIEVGDVVAIEEIGATAFDFMLYPNPAQNQINIGFEGQSEAKGTVEIYDGLGRLISLVSNDLAGKEQLKIDVSDLVTGFYFLKINLENQQIAKRFLIQR